MQLHSGETYGANTNDLSYTPRPFRGERPLSAYANQNRKQGFNKESNTDHTQKKRWNPNRKNGNFQNKSSNHTPINACSACGLRGLKIQTCRNIVNDAGWIIELLPTQGTCDKCPEKVQPRLRHPDFLCPYRPGAPLHIKHIN
jgi:hypothetical protein